MTDDRGLLSFYPTTAQYTTLHEVFGDGPYGVPIYGGVGEALSFSEPAGLLSALRADSSLIASYPELKTCGWGGAVGAPIYQVQVLQLTTTKVNVETMAKNYDTAAPASSATLTQPTAIEAPQTTPVPVETPAPAQWPNSTTAPGAPAETSQPAPAVPEPSSSAASSAPSQPAPWVSPPVPSIETPLHPHRSTRRALASTRHPLNSHIRDLRALHRPTTSHNRRLRVHPGFVVGVRDRQPDTESLGRRLSRRLDRVPAEL